jgi:hypothetical protein
MLTGRIASQSPFILLPRYAEEYGGFARRMPIKEVVGIARNATRTPEELAFAEYVSSTAQGRLMGRAINRKQIYAPENSNAPILKADQFFGTGANIDPFLLPYKSGFDRSINNFLSNGEIPFKGDRVEELMKIDANERLAAIAHIPKMLERWENLPVIYGDVYRGNDRGFAWNKGIEKPARFISASENRDVARRFGDQQIVIQSTTGRRLAGRDAEEEVLFAPNTIFRLKDNNISPVYVESGSMPMPRIPSYQELKAMSEKARRKHEALSRQQAATKLSKPPAKQAVYIPEEASFDEDGFPLF